MGTKNYFGDILKELLRSKNLTTRKLAKELGVPYRTAQEWVGSGGRTPRDLDVIKKLADLLGCSVHFLLFGIEDPRSSLGEILDKTELHTGLYEITIRKVSTKKSGGKNK